MNDKLTDFQQLNVWQKAHRLVLDVYEISKKFPKDERGELIRDVRSAAADIPIKIAEGFNRRGPRDKEFSYRDAQNAIERVKYHLILAKDLGYVKDNEEILLAVREVARMLSGLVRSVKGK